MPPPKILENAYGEYAPLAMAGAQCSQVKSRQGKKRHALYKRQRVSIESKSSKGEQVAAPTGRTGSGAARERRVTDEDDRSGILAGGGAFGVADRLRCRSVLAAF